jgi:hypothetical protein
MSEKTTKLLPTQMAFSKELKIRELESDYY